mmetsp:Transcript_41903/g.132118  ORF Transcript_41903/g.132118 Transcript_41903/m.132118 type:complete len:125 (+) Transcript_41903:677-1051(+)
MGSSSDHEDERRTGVPRFHERKAVSRKKVLVYSRMTCSLLFISFSNKNRCILSIFDTIRVREIYVHGEGDMTETNCRYHLECPAALTCHFCTCNDQCRCFLGMLFLEGRKRSWCYKDETSLLVT